MKPVKSAELDVTVSAKELNPLVRLVFENCGVNTDDAKLVAETLVEANLRGHPSHGVIRAPKWADGLQAGAINANCVPAIVGETPAVAWLDGDRGLGPVVADCAVKIASAKARSVGVGIACVRRASHIAMLQYYVDAMARTGLIGIVMTNTEPGVAPYGGIDKILGTNPIAIGIPTRSQPLILDMSTSHVARGKIVIAKSRGERIPDHWAIDNHGRPTTDPEAALAGALLPIAGAKGSGLSMMIDLLTGALAGASVGLRVHGTFDMKQEGTKGDLFLALSPDAFCGRDKFLDKVHDLRADVRSSRLAPGFDTIMLPGEVELACRRRHLRNGIRIEKSLLAELNKRAREPVPVHAPPRTTHA